MDMVIGERRIAGRVREKVAAREAYQQARRGGRRASLVERQRPNLFTNRVANIGPGEVVEVSLEYVQPADYDNGRFSLRLPTTLTPRYVPGVPLAPSLLRGRASSIRCWAGPRPPTWCPMGL